MYFKQSKARSVIMIILFEYKSFIKLLYSQSPARANSILQLSTLLSISNFFPSFISSLVAVPTLPSKVHTCVCPSVPDCEQIDTSRLCAGVSVNFSTLYGVRCSCWELASLCLFQSTRLGDVWFGSFL